jgi:hypothetical protein
MFMRRTLSSTAMPENLHDLATQSISRDGLSHEDLTRELALLGPRWWIADGFLRLDLSGPMARTGVAAAFAGTLADELDQHHNLRITIDSSTMTLLLRDRETRKIRVIDLIYAARLEQWLRANGWPI